MADFEELPIVALEVPELNETQLARNYLMVIPEFKQFRLEPLSATDLLTITKMNDSLAVKVKNAVYRFVSTAKPGSHLWVGHMLPMVFCLSDDNEVDATLVPKVLDRV